jgi:hypothetical protein
VLVEFVIGYGALLKLESTELLEVSTGAVDDKRKL